MQLASSDTQRINRLKQKVPAVGVRLSASDTQRINHPTNGVRLAASNTQKINRVWLAAYDIQRINPPTSSGGWCAAATQRRNRPTSSGGWCVAGGIRYRDDNLLQSADGLCADVHQSATGQVCHYLQLGAMNKQRITGSVPSSGCKSVRLAASRQW